MQLTNCMKSNADWKQACPRLALAVLAAAAAAVQLRANIRIGHLLRGLLCGLLRWCLHRVAHTSSFSTCRPAAVVLLCVASPLYKSDV